MTKQADSREIALDILIEVMERGGYSHVVIGQALGKYQYLDKQERSFISRVSVGTLEYLIQIDDAINQVSKINVTKMKPLIRNLIRMSVYQILYLDRIPDSAVCNEAVKLAEKRKFQGLKGFVNGVLRSVSRNKESFTWTEDSVRYSIPGWMLSIWEKVYGLETARKIAASFLETRKTTVRCNLGLANLNEILESLTKQGVTISHSTYAQEILYLEEYDYLESLEAFRKGWIQVQDMSSSFVGRIAAPKSGNYVIDVCGAPGGKSLHIADLLCNTGMVDVRDLTYKKVLMIEENINRTGFTNIRAKVQDALVLDAESVEKADILIADLPCSGLGIIGKKPDIRYKMTLKQTAELAKLQREILSVVYQYVKPGGVLLYSTCTINQKENEENAEWFLHHFPFEPLDISEALGQELEAASMKRGQIQLLPGIHPCDGFFIAAFRKIRK